MSTTKSKLKSKTVASAEAGLSAAEVTMNDFLATENKKANILYLAGAFMVQVGIALAVICAAFTYQPAPLQNEKLFTINNWPNTISSLIYDPLTTYGRVFYAFVLIGGFAVFLSWRFTYSFTEDEDFGDTKRMARHVIISVGIMGLVLIPTSQAVNPDTPVVIMEVCHYLFAFAAILVHPITEIMMQWKNAGSDMTRYEKIKLMWGSWFCIVVALAFVAVRLSINILSYKNETISNALPITSFALEWAVIIVVMINAWYNPY